MLWYQVYCNCDDSVMIALGCMRSNPEECGVNNQSNPTKTALVAKTKQTHRHTMHLKGSCSPIQIWPSCCFFVPSAPRCARNEKAARGSDLNRTRDHVTSHGNAFRITGLLWGESTSCRQWIPLTHIGQVRRTFEISFVVNLNKLLCKSGSPVIWDAMLRMWCHSPSGQMT